MVITLIPGGIGGDSSAPGARQAAVVAKVEGTDITADQVRQTARQMLQQQMPQGGANMGMLLPFFAQRARRAVDHRQALLAEAGRMGLHAYATRK